MKLMQQFLVILAISFIGEILNYIIPLPVPGSIYGMIILFLALVTGVIKLSSVERAGKYMLEVLPIMFIPAGVGLMASWGILRPIIIPMSIVMVVSTFTVLAATGWTSQFIVRRNRKKNSGMSNERVETGAVGMTEVVEMNGVMEIKEVNEMREVTERE